MHEIWCTGAVHIWCTAQVLRCIENLPQEAAFGEFRLTNMYCAIEVNNHHLSDAQVRINMQLSSTQSFKRIEDTFPWLNSSMIFR